MNVPEREKEWTPQELRLLRERVRAGASLGDMASALSRTPDEVVAKLREIGLLRREA